MFFIEPIEYAIDYKSFVKKIADANGFTDLTAYAVLRLYGDSELVSLRDRSVETAKMLKGLKGDLNAEIKSVILSGSDLYRFGFDAKGAQFTQIFKIMFV